jgi:hypothetical protein
MMVPVTSCHLFVSAFSLMLESVAVFSRPGRTVTSSQTGGGRLNLQGSDRFPCALRNIRVSTFVVNPWEQNIQGSAVRTSRLVVGEVAGMMIKAGGLGDTRSSVPHGWKLGDKGEHQLEQQRVAMTEKAFGGGREFQFWGQFTQLGPCASRRDM